MDISLKAGFRLSPQQRRLWQQQESGVQAYSSVAFSIAGDLDVDRLRTALTTAASRHEALRTLFQRASGMKLPFQVVADQSAPEWLQTSATAGDLPHAVDAAMTNSSAPLRATLLTCEDRQHYLVLRSPAILADVQSLLNLGSEMAQLYSGRTDLAQPLQYADYSEWHNTLLNGEDGDRDAAAKTFWQRTVSDLTATAVPLAHARDGEPKFRRIPLHASSAEPSDSVLLACWLVWLWRYAAGNATSTSIIANGRTHEEFAEGIGAYEKPLPVPVQFASGTGFADAVVSARQLRADAEDHQDYFSPLHENAPITAISLRSIPPPQRYGQLHIAIERVCTKDPAHILAFEVSRSSTGTVHELVYDSACISDDIAACMARSLTTLLSVVTERQTASVSELPILAEDDREYIVRDFNQTSAPYPRGQCFHHRFEESAALHSDSPALRFRDDVYTFGELNARANSLAHFLRKQGVGPNVSVALYLDRSAEMIIALLAVHKAGGCYVPLVPGDPKTRLVEQLKQAEVRLLLTRAASKSDLPDFAGAVVSVDDGFAEEPETNPEHVNKPEDLAYIIYTSGSTGVPKGVAVRHFSLANYTHFITADICKGEEGLHFASVSTLAADLGNTSIFPPMISGGCLHIIDYETAMSATEYADYLSQHPVDVLKITPSQITALLRGSIAGSVLPRRYLVLGGERLSWELAQELKAQGTCELINHCAPTECTIGCSTLRVTGENRWGAATVPIGRPIANAQSYVLDARLQPVPLGVVGEWCVGGECVAAGYINQPQQTAERFVHDAFANQAGSRLYRTGDMARLLPDGTVEILGRIDQQVKIRGFRVEPAEVEAAILRHPAALQCAVVAERDSLSAYVVARGTLEARDLRDFLRTQVPEYLVPARLISVPSIPLTGNGKVDAHVLRAFADSSQRPEVQQPIDPRNETEEKLLTIWQEVLKQQQIGVTDNFFNIGGHSLLAMQIMSRVRNAFRVQVPLHVFIARPTIAELATNIADAPRPASQEPDTARLLEQLEGLSDEEAEQLLAQLEAEDQ